MAVAYTSGLLKKGDKSNMNPESWIKTFGVLVIQRHSVPETPSYGTEYACRAQNRLLWYATHFLRHSV